MKRLVLFILPVLAFGIVATELTMDLTSEARMGTYSIYAATVVLTLVLYVVTTRIARNVASLATAVVWVAIATVAVAAVAVIMAARSMFFSDHDRDVLLVVLAMGVGLAVALAFAIGRSAGRDLDRIRTVTEAVAAGDLTVRTGVHRRDEVGDTAVAVDSMIERLENTEEERRILLASIGHDLRTPLAALRAAIEAVEDGVAPDPDRYLAGMSKDVRYLGRLVDDLFEFARIESGRFRPDRERVDLRELADEAVEVCAPLAQRSDVALACRAERMVEVDVDTAAMGRVLRNLIDNAIEHSPAHGTVSVEVFDCGFRVVDEGPGFPSEFRSVAFDRFTRADPARSGGGAGLGLAIARGIVEAHGGRIEIEEGSGGRVCVLL